MQPPFEITAFTVFENGPSRSERISALYAVIYKNAVAISGPSDFNEYFERGRPKVTNSVLSVSKPFKRIRVDEERGD